MDSVRHIVLVLFLLPWMLPGSFAAAPSHPLAIHVAQAGYVTISNEHLRQVGWLSSVPRTHLRLTRNGQEQPLTDVGHGLAFLGEPSESRWTSEAVYWLSHADQPALRGALPTRLSTPFTWEPDMLYDRQYASSRGDSWWAGEIRLQQPLQAQIQLAEATPAATPVLLVVRSTEARRLTSVSLTVGGTTLTTTWSSADTVTHTLMLPPLPAGTSEFVLATTGAPVLVDRLVFPTVFTSASPSVAPVVLRPRQQLPTPPSNTDLLILTHPLFQPSLEPLIAAHTALGRRVFVMDVQSAYDTWSAGERHPDALREVIRTIRPKSVLLVGSGTTALRQPSPARPTFVPPYLVRVPRDGEVACETCFVRHAPGDPTMQLPEVPIGRFPVTTVAEVDALVSKTVTALLSPPPGAWRARALVVTDNDVEVDGQRDPAGSFVATAETLLRSIPPGIARERHYYTTDRDVTFFRCHLFRLLDGGRSTDRCPVVTDPGVALWMYVGHGSPWQWAATTPQAATPYLWYLYDADRLRNQHRAPIVLALSCFTADSAHPVLQTTDERLVLRRDGGAVAVLGSSGSGVNTGHAHFAQGVIAALYRRQPLGQAHLEGIRLVMDTHPEFSLSMGLLGDPWVTLPFVPKHHLYVPALQEQP
jgi:Peptidase family C25